VRPGRYATEINIHNFRDRDVTLAVQFIPLVLAGAARGREPQVAGVTAREKLRLAPHSASMIDCCRILELLLGAKPSAQIPLTIGMVELAAPSELGVTAVYTVTDLGNLSTSIEVENVEAKTATPTSSARKTPS
jgi:hypothetical protein